MSRTKAECLTDEIWKLVLDSRLDYFDRYRALGMALGVLASFDAKQNEAGLLHALNTIDVAACAARSFAVYSFEDTPPAPPPAAEPPSRLH